MTINVAHLLLLPLLLVAITPSMAEENAFIPDVTPRAPASVEPGKPWQEGTAQFPPWPQDTDLVELQIDGSTRRFRYFIDSRNLQVGSDQVVRYTLIAESGSGTRNLSYEGIRCTPKGRYKVFAYGLDGHFSPSENPDWRLISDDRSEPYRNALWQFHFCIPRQFLPKTRKDIIRSLKLNLAN